MEHSPYKKAAIQIPNDLRYLSVAINFVLQNAILRGFAEKQLDAIELAVEEAVSNVIRHAFKATEQAEFSVICEQIPLGLKIIVKDQGMPFDPMLLPEYDPKLLKKDTPIQGLGWHLMQRSMDEVIFHNLGPEGKEIHLIKYLYEKTEEDLPEEQAVAIPEKQVSDTPPASQPAPFKVRKAKPSDAIEIAKCAYDAYGYSYKEYIYYPERLNQMIADGGIISVVAVTKDEKEAVIAHAALVFEDPGEKIAEMGMAFTKKSHQGQGCGKKMGVLLVKEVLKHRLRGWYAYTTTAHIFSQKTANKTGARDCCILLGDAPASRKNQNFSAAPERGTRVYCFLNTQIFALLKLQFRKKKIYAPAQHLGMIQKIYSNLGEKVAFLTDDTDVLVLPDSAPLIDTYTKPGRLSAKIKVKSYGTGIVPQVQTLVKKLCIDKYEVITLYLNLHDPLTAKLTAKFESLGFFFIGILPGAKSGDQLALQYLNNILIHYEAIQLYSDFAKELLAYIKERDPVRL